MKKLVILVLVATLALGLVTQASSAVTIKFWTHQNTAWNESYKGLIAEYEAAHPDVNIEYTTFPYSDFEAKIQTSLMAGSGGADLYEVSGSWITDFAASGKLSEVPADFLKELRDDTYAPVMGASQIDGRFYGVPVEFNAEYGGMLVNKKLFEKSGLEYPKTWTEVLDIARKVAVQNGEVMEMRGLEYAGSDSLTTNWLSMILQKGGNYRAEDGTLDLANPIAVACMEELVSYQTVDHVTNNDSLTNAQGIADHAFIAIDECYMCISGTWTIADLEESYGVKFGTDFEYISQPPFVEDVDPKWVATTGWTLSVPSASPVRDQAWEFVQYLLEPENLMRHNIESAQIPPRKSVAMSPEYLAKVPYMNAIVNILPYAQHMGAFNAATFKRYTSQMFLSLCANDGTYTSVEDACQRLTTDLNSVLTFY